MGIKLNSADCPQSGSLEDVTYIAKKIDASDFLLSCIFYHLF